MSHNVTVRMDDDLYNALQQAAASEKRKVGEMLRIILEENIERYKNRLRRSTDQGEG